MCAGRADGAGVAVVASTDLKPVENLLVVGSPGDGACYESGKKASKQPVASRRRSARVDLP